MRRKKEFETIDYSKLELSLFLKHETKSPVTHRHVAFTVLAQADSGSGVQARA